MKTVIVAAMFAGMLGFTAHGQAVPSYAPAQEPTSAPGERPERRRWQGCT
jgi:hypothetical protein